MMIETILLMTMSTGKAGAGSRKDITRMDFFLFSFLFSLFWSDGNWIIRCCARQLRLSDSLSLHHFLRGRLQERQTFVEELNGSSLKHPPCMCRLVLLEDTSYIELQLGISRAFDMKVLLRPPTGHTLITSST